MRDTKHNSMLAAAMIIGLGAGLPPSGKPRSVQRSDTTTQAKKYRPPGDEIEAWNAAVDTRKAERKAERKARKEQAQTDRRMKGGA